MDAGHVLAEVLAALAVELVPLANGDPSRLLARWRSMAPSSVGTPVECETAAGRKTGVAAGVAEDGALLVRIGDRLERIIAGEIIWK